MIYYKNGPAVLHIATLSGCGVKTIREQFSGKISLRKTPDLFIVGAKT